jgi:hypothetical protein
VSNYFTDDFADIVSFSRERGMLIDIMRAWGDTGLPADFDECNIRPAFNRNSGYVFLVNDEHQVCMLRDGKLESFYTSPYEGKEGFFDELLEEYADMHPEDQRWMRDIADHIGRDIPEVDDAEV